MFYDYYDDYDGDNVDGIHCGHDIVDIQEGNADSPGSWLISARLCGDESHTSLPATFQTTENLVAIRSVSFKDEIRIVPK